MPENENLYMFLNLASISVPFLASFHPRLKFYKKWKALSLAIFLTTAFYIIWDVIFTYNGFWGFNERYFLGLKIAYLPIEEWLFFICIPYACVFTHYSLLDLFPKIEFPEALFKPALALFMLLWGIFAVLFYDKWYTLVNFTYALVLTPIVYKYNRPLLQKYLVTFLVMLIPFFLVNGVLTGSWIESEVVWYNNNENLHFRLGTIPVEDVTYAFTLILSNLALLEFFLSRKKISPSS